MHVSRSHLWTRVHTCVYISVSISMSLSLSSVAGVQVSVSLCIRQAHLSFC